MLLSLRSKEPWKSWWDAPGGFLGFEELPREGAIREAKEETGLDIKIEGVISEQTIVYGKDQEHLVSFYYLAKVTGGKMKNNYEVLELRWFDVDNLPKKSFRLTSAPLKISRNIWIKRKLARNL